jgi:hypothetical protein
MDEEKDLREQLEIVKSQNINLRFDTVEKELTEIKNLLKDYVLEIKNNREEALAIAKLLDNRVTKLEEGQRNCPVKVMKAELHRYSRETSFLRGMFKNPWKGAILLSLWIAIITILVVSFGPSGIFEGVMRLRLISM